MKELTLLLSVLAIWACESEDRNQYEQLKGSAQGTTFSIVYEPVDTADYTIEIDSIFKTIDKSMSLWDSTSIISKFNRETNAITVDDHFRAVVQKSRAIYDSTNGGLDITLGPIIRSWGFIRKNGLPVPADSTIAKSLTAVGMDKIVLQGSTLTKLNSNVELDVNAIAQGYTVDVLVAYLRGKGISNLLVELGGEVRAHGVNQFGEAWKVGIEKPEYNDGVGRNSIKAVIALENKALVTSGSNRKYIEVDGKKYSHTIDPKTGYPVSHSLLSVSVIADNAADADGYATAFMVLGVTKSIELAEQLGLEIFCIYDEGGTFKTASTEGFSKYILEEV